VNERNERAQRQTEDWAALGRIHQLAAVLAVAGDTGLGVVDGVLAVAGEVGALGLQADVLVEPAGDADGDVGIADVLILEAVDAAVDGVEVAVTGVEVDPRVGMVGGALGRLGPADCRGAGDDPGHGPDDGAANHTAIGKAGQTWHCSTSLLERRGTLEGNSLATCGNRAFVSLAEFYWSRPRRLDIFWHSCLCSYYRFEVRCRLFRGHEATFVDWSDTITR
jgi:hypothetical protein